MKRTHYIALGLLLTAIPVAGVASADTICQGGDLIEGGICVRVGDGGWSGQGQTDVCVESRWPTGSTCFTYVPYQGSPSCESPGESGWGGLYSSSSNAALPYAFFMYSSCNNWCWDEWSCTYMGQQQSSGVGLIIWPLGVTPGWAVAWFGGTGPYGDYCVVVVGTPATFDAFDCPTVPGMGDLLEPVFTRHLSVRGDCHNQPVATVEFCARGTTRADGVGVALCTPDRHTQVRILQTSQTTGALPGDYVGAAACIVAKDLLAP